MEEYNEVKLSRITKRNEREVRPRPVMTWNQIIPEKDKHKMNEF